MQLFKIGAQLGIGEFVDNLAMLHDVVAVRDGRSEAEVLFDEQDRETLLLQSANRASRSAG
jgi:hypothetical protein